MKYFTLGFLCLLLSCCTLEFKDTGCGPGTNRTCGPVTYVDYDTTIETYYDGCSYDPYYWSPEWCDWYDDDTTCCVWLVDGWYEEWCQWENDWCWEYNGAW